MNDLAEKALRGLTSAHRQVVSRPATSLAVVGLVVSSFVVAAGGAVAALRPTRSLTTWLGVQTDHGLGRGAAAGLLLGGTVALVALWLTVAEVARRRALPAAKVWAIGAAMAAPFALGPPLSDTTVYSSAAFGFVQRAGRSPATDAPSSLGDVGLVGAIDPSARGTVSAAGPLGSLLQHLAVSVGGGTALGTVIVLRVVGVLSAVAIGRLAGELAGRGPRTDAIVLAALNPLVLLYVVSSPHLEGPMAALTLASLVAARRRRWLPAVTSASLAAAVLAQAFVLVSVVITAHVLARRRSARWRIVLRDVAVVAVVSVGLALAQPGGFGWVGAITKQFSATTPFSIPYATGRVLAPIVAGASYDDLVVSGRITAAIAAACALVYLLLSARHRSTERTAGFALLALALLAPNLFPWYLLWGLVCLAPGASGDRRLAVVAMSAAGCALLPAGLGPVSSDIVTAAGLAAVGLAAGWTLRRAYRPPETSRTAGRTSAR